MSFTRDQAREAWLQAWVLAGKPEAHETFARIVMGHMPNDEQDLVEMIRQAFLTDPREREMQ